MNIRWQWNLAIRQFVLALKLKTIFFTFRHSTLRIRIESTIGNRSCLKKCQCRSSAIFKIALFAILLTTPTLNWYLGHTQFSVSEMVTLSIFQLSDENQQPVAFIRRLKHFYPFCWLFETKKKWLWLSLLSFNVIHILHRIGCCFLSWFSWAASEKFPSAFKKKRIFTSFYWIKGRRYNDSVDRSYRINRIQFNVFVQKMLELRSKSLLCFWAIKCPNYSRHANKQKRNFISPSFPQVIKMKTIFHSV